MEKEIVLQLPLCSNNLLCARLTAFAVCSLMKIDINETEDVKVCVNEACLIMMNSRYASVNLKFNMENNLKICVQGSGKCESPIESDEKSREIGLLLLNSLIDEVEYKKEGGVISSIVLTKRM